LGLELEFAAVAFLIALPLTLLLRLPTKAGRVAAHAGIPRIGGFSIVTAFVLTPPLMAMVNNDARAFLRDDWGHFLALGLCGGLVFVVGAIDDFRDLNWKTKFSAQIVAAIGLYLAGFRVGEMTLPGGGTLELGIADAPLTVLWLVFMANALNLIDGHDGVAAGISALVSATIAYAAYDLGHELIALLFAALAGASLGFMPLNLPPAKRFLGDSGAYFLGLTIAALSVAGFVDSTGRVPLYIPVVALGLPVLDTGVSFLRRILDGRNPMAADMDHFHHRVQRLLHWGPLQTAFAAYGLTALFCGAALLLHTWYKSAGSAVVGAVVLAFAVLLVTLLGYVRTMWESVRHGRRGEKVQPEAVHEAP